MLVHQRVLPFLASRVNQHGKWPIYRSDQPLKNADFPSPTWRIHHHSGVSPPNFNSPSFLVTRFGSVAKTTTNHTGHGIGWWIPSRWADFLEDPAACHAWWSNCSSNCSTWKNQWPCFFFISRCLSSKNSGFPSPHRSMWPQNTSKAISSNAVQCSIYILYIYTYYIPEYTWWLIPLSKWVITPVISGLTLLIPFITGVITHLLSGMSHQVLFS